MPNDDRHAAPAAGIYAGASAALATMHGKELAIGPPLRSGLGLTVVVPEHLDTDALGTFTGEIERPAGMLETAIRKARLGMERSGLAVGIASEGSYGPHPVVPFLPLGRELIVFVDDDRKLIVHEQLLAEKTNFAHVVVRADDPPDDFLERAGFPDHALIARQNSATEGSGIIVKGLKDKDALAEAIDRCATASDDGRARLETDMRAHMNPTRMQAIEALTQRLVSRLKTECPACKSPGFGKIDVRKGLPCTLCGMPTDLVAVEVFGCPSCDHREDRARSDRLEGADPGQCPACNP